MQFPNNMPFNPIPTTDSSQLSVKYPTLEEKQLIKLIGQIKFESVEIEAFKSALQIYVGFLRKNVLDELPLHINNLIQIELDLSGVEVFIGKEHHSLISDLKNNVIVLKSEYLKLKSLIEQDMRINNNISVKIVGTSEPTEGKYAGRKITVGHSNYKSQYKFF